MNKLTNEHTSPIINTDLYVSVRKIVSVATEIVRLLLIFMTI